MVSMIWVLVDDRGREVGVFRLNTRQKRIEVEHATGRWRGPMETLLATRREIRSQLTGEVIRGRLGNDPRLFADVIGGHASWWGLRVRADGVEAAPTAPWEGIEDPVRRFEVMSEHATNVIVG
jgi:hypothetical protein